MVKCELPIPPPETEEIAGVLDYSIPGGCFRSFLLLDDSPVETISFGKGSVPFSVKTPGSRFGIALTADDSCAAENPETFVRVSNVSHKREGWWTSSTPRCAGIRDLRDEGCGLRFENLRWWGMSGNPAKGTLLVHRELRREYSGIRYRMEHNFQGPFFKFRLLLDDKPVKDYSLQSPYALDEALEGTRFSLVAFQFGVNTSDQYPFRWAVSISGLEVLDESAGWISLCEAAEAQPAFDVSGQGAIEDVFAYGEEAVVTEAGETGGTVARGCTAVSSPLPGGKWQVLLLCLFLLLLLRRSRLSRV